jgi:hypothetical protein
MSFRSHNFADMKPWGRTKIKEAWAQSDVYRIVRTGDNIRSCPNKTLDRRKHEFCDQLPVAGVLGFQVRSERVSVHNNRRMMMIRKLHISRTFADFTKAESCSLRTATDQPDASHGKSLQSALLSR